MTVRAEMFFGIRSFSETKALVEGSDGVVGAIPL